MFYDVKIIESQSGEFGNHGSAIQIIILKAILGKKIHSLNSCSVPVSVKIQN